jgi:regulation of enolase protein 1 (concanavalin A-like superfamily)
MDIDFRRVSKLPENFQWLNEPEYRLEQGLKLATQPETDFWQSTHYGFRRDDGHFLHIPREGDFCIETSCHFDPVSQYDQCGLMVRTDRNQWIKCSVEYESDTLSRLGSVVTNYGFSDWATQDIPSSTKSMRYRIKREGEDFIVQYAPAQHDWRQMRIAHLHHCKNQLAIGVYACSPTGKGFTCQFDYLSIR